MVAVGQVYPEQSSGPACHRLSPFSNPTAIVREKRFLTCVLITDCFHESRMDLLTPRPKPCALRDLFFEFNRLRRAGSNTGGASTAEIAFGRRSLVGKRPDRSERAGNRAQVATNTKAFHDQFGTRVRVNSDRVDRTHVQAPGFGTL